MEHFGGIVIEPQIPKFTTRKIKSIKVEALMTARQPIT
jgi:hypothetical protein